MKLLIIAALVAVAAARPQEYHDDVFHFSTIVNPESFSRSSFQPAYNSFESQQPVVSKQVTVQQYSAAAPAFTKQYTVQQQQAPLFFKTVDQEVPVYSQQQYTVQQVPQRAYTKQYTVQQVAQPDFTKQYTVQQVAQQPDYTQYSNQYSVQKLTPPAYSQYSNQYSSSSSGSLVGQANYAQAYSGPQYRILSRIQEVDPTGPYKASYATENGIQASEQGHLINGAEGPVVASEGTYSYTGPDGVVYTINWVADDNGFRASGAHLPVAPAIPEEILRSLEANAASNERYDDQGRLLFKK